VKVDRPRRPLYLGFVRHRVACGAISGVCLCLFMQYALLSECSIYQRGRLLQAGAWSCMLAVTGFHGGPPYVITASAPVCSRCSLLASGDDASKIMCRFTVHLFACLHNTSIEVRKCTDQKLYG